MPPDISQEMLSTERRMEERCTIDCSYCGFLATAKSLNEALATARRLATQHSTGKEKVSVYDRLAQRGTCQVYDIAGRCLEYKAFKLIIEQFPHGQVPEEMEIGGDLGKLKISVPPPRGTPLPEGAVRRKENIRTEEQIVDEAEAVIEALDRKWRSTKARNSTHAGADLDALEAKGYEVEEARDALQSYKDIVREDFDDADEFSEARTDAWEEFVDSIGTITKEEEAGEPKELPSGARLPENAVRRTEKKLDAAVKHLGYESVETSDSNIRTDQQILSEAQARLHAAQVVPDEQLSGQQFTHLKLARAITRDFWAQRPTVHAAIIPPASDRVRTAGMYGVSTQAIYISVDQLHSGRDTIDTLIHELGHHKQYLVRNEAEDLTESHAFAMTDIAARVVQQVAGGRFDKLLKEVIW